MDTITESPAVEVMPPAAPWEALPEGEYAIVELFGHTTLVGRITEVERFGTKLMAVEVVFNGRLLEPVNHGGPAIYRHTPCSRKVAWERQHRELWQLPAAIKATLPPEALPAPSATDAGEAEIGF